MPPAYYGFVFVHNNQERVNVNFVAEYGKLGRQRIYPVLLMLLVNKRMQYL